MGATIAESDRDFPLYHQACFTCVVNGAICSNQNAVYEPTKGVDEACRLDDESG